MSIPGNAAACRQTLSGAGCLGANNFCRVGQIHSNLPRAKEDFVLTTDRLYVYSLRFMTFMGGADKCLHNGNFLYFLMSFTLTVFKFKSLLGT